MKEQLFSTAAVLTHMLQAARRPEHSNAAYATSIQQMCQLGIPKRAFI